MKRKRLIDLFCGIGAASVGYTEAGYDVIGVDIEPQGDYPFEFVQMDAFEFGFAHLDDFDAWHASSPCQNYIAITKGNRARGWKDQHPDLIVPTRHLLAEVRKRRPRPTVIECGVGNHLRSDVRLCGEMFGLGVIRHRDFEIDGADVPRPLHIPHRGRVRGWRHGQFFDGPYVAVYGEGGGKGSVEEWQKAMGIPWSASRKGIAEAIPPAYTRYVGEHILGVR